MLSPSDTKTFLGFYPLQPSALSIYPHEFVDVGLFKVNLEFSFSFLSFSFSGLDLLSFQIWVSNMRFTQQLLIVSLWFSKYKAQQANACFELFSQVWHQWQLKRPKSWGPFWSYQLNSTANSAHLAHFHGE